MSTPSQPDKDKDKDKDKNKGKPPETFTQDFQISNLSARVPDAVSRGVFCNGVLVMQGGSEFVLDFVLRMNQPHRIVSRVVLPTNFVPQVIDALRDNLEIYKKNFGGPPVSYPAPQQPPPRQPSIEEIYQDLKIADELLTGSYANAVMVGHTFGEFGLDFIFNFYPRAAVAARVFLCAPQMPVLVQSLSQSWQALQNKLQNPPPKPPPQN